MITSHFDRFLNPALNILDVQSDKIQVYDRALALLVDHVLNHTAALTDLADGVTNQFTRPVFETFYGWPVGERPMPELFEQTKDQIAGELHALIDLLRDAQHHGLKLMDAYEALDIPYLDFASRRESHAVTLARREASESHTPQGW